MTDTQSNLFSTVSGEKKANKQLACAVRDLLKEERSIFYQLSIVEIVIVMSSRTSRRTWTVSRDVMMVTLFSVA